MAKRKDGSTMQIVEITVHGEENVWYEGASEKTLASAWNKAQSIDASYAERAAQGLTDIDGWTFYGVWLSTEKPREPVARLEIRHVQETRTYTVKESYTCKSLPADGNYARREVKFR
jgi:hypothetical protein